MFIFLLFRSIRNIIMLIHYFLALAPGCHILITLGNMVTNMVQIRELTHFTIMTISNQKKAICHDVHIRHYIIQLFRQPTYDHYRVFDRSPTKNLRKFQKFQMNKKELLIKKHKNTNDPVCSLEISGAHKIYCQNFFSLVQR